MTTNMDEFLGKRLRQRRRSLGLTQQQVGDVIGVRFQQIHKYECGLNRISAARLWRIARALEAPVEFFFEGMASVQQPPASVHDTHTR
jgi:transcriptional regulator with XRE-family HTH domain